jgi:uncharacterized membrane protein YgcG
MLKRLVFIVFCFLAALSAFVFSQEEKIPPPQDTVSDYSSLNLVSPKTKKEVEVLAEELKMITSVNLKVLVVCSLPPSTAEVFGQDVYEEWDVGQKKEGLDHGVLIVISCIDRRAKIITGKGVSHILTRPIRERFEWDILAALAEGKFSEGVEIGARSVAQLLIMEWETKKLKPFVNWQLISLSLLALVLATTVVTYLFQGDLLLVFEMIVGGIFGYLFFGVWGMVLGWGLGFFVSYGRLRKGRKMIRRIRVGKK